MRAVNEKSTVEELTLRVADLTARVAELARRLELTERIGGNGHAAQQTAPGIRPAQETIPSEQEADESESPIEFHTESGFAIVRPWEAGERGAPADGEYRLRVSDSRGNERDVTVNISRQLLLETEMHTCGRVQHASRFWICCAERHLAKYVDEHDAFPNGNQLIVESLDPEEVLSAIRWKKK